VWLWIVGCGLTGDIQMGRDDSPVAISGETYIRGEA
jgi:hypothetical protein